MLDSITCASRDARSDAGAREAAASNRRKRWARGSAARSRSGRLSAAVVLAYNAAHERAGGCGGMRVRGRRKVDLEDSRGDVPRSASEVGLGLGRIHDLGDGSWPRSRARQYSPSEPAPTSLTAPIWDRRARRAGLVPLGGGDTLARTTPRASGASRRNTTLDHTLANLRSAEDSGPRDSVRAPIMRSGSHA